MTEKTLRARLEGCAWKDRVIVEQTLPSTNTRLAELARQGAPAGTVLIANAQSAGRGRMGRSFLSPEGGLYLSALLRPACRPEELMHLTAAAGAAAALAVRDAFSLECGIKWVNDLTLHGKKLAGILTELSLRPGELFAVIGVGVNCRRSAFSPEVSALAVSAEEEMGREADPEVLAAAMIRRLEELDRTVLTRKAQWMQEFSRRCVTVGKPVRLLQDDAEQEAFALGVGENAELLVRLPDGSVRAVQSGEVSVRGLYGYAEP